MDSPDLRAPVARPPRVTRTVIDELVRLIEREASVRQAARLLELEPGAAVESRELFGRANKIREERIRLLERHGLA